MPSTVYKSDLSEITFGHETGVRLEHDYAAGTSFTQASCTHNDGTTITHPANANIVTGLRVTGSTGIPTDAYVAAILSATTFQLSATTTAGSQNQTLTFDPDFKFIAGGGDKDTVSDTSVISFRGGQEDTPVFQGILEYPNGMLVGSKVIFTIGSSSPEWDTQDDYAVSGRMFTIIKQEVATSGDNNGCTEITITPALKTDHSSVDKDSKTNDVMTILPFTTPAMDVGMQHADAANESAESVLTDQFIGLVSTVALPETKVDLKRYHVVGLGRDVAVQVPGRFTNVGGSFECNIHNGRWFYYCLGHEVVSAPEVRQNGHTNDTFSLSSAVYSGDSYIAFDSSGSTNPAIGGTDIGVGDYIFLLGGDNTEGVDKIDVQSYRDTNVNAEVFTNATCVTTDTDASITIDSTAKLIVGMSVSGTGIPTGATVSSVTNATSFELSANATASNNPITLTFDPRDISAWPNVDATQIIDKAMKEEARRIVAITVTGGAGKVWLDDPLQFSYEDNTVVKFARYAANDSNGSPHRNTTTGAITKPVSHLFFSRTTVPSFAMEVSVRRRDIDSNDGTTDGGTGDSKQLTRVFRGCKVKDFSLTTDTDAALRLTANFDSALCYTDTGRLEASNKGDRYNTHRLFEDTANTEVKRKVSGIGKGTQKPFMFYNGSISMLGTTLGQVVSFTLNGKTGVEQYYTIGASNIANSATDQVPFAGTRNPTLAVEGKTEYDLEMEIIVDDPLFYHNMRRAVENFDDTDETAQTDSDMIRLSFTKQVSSGTAESIDILMDDYYIVEAPLPVPEDKGPLMAKLKILPKSVKVIAVDTVIHA